MGLNICHETQRKHGNLSMNKIITFIGAGNMTRSLVTGLTKNKTQHDIRISDPDSEQLKNIQDHCPKIVSFSDNIKATQGAHIIVLAVKPQLMEIVCENIKQVMQDENPLIISIAAGVTINKMSNWLAKKNSSIVRCMPNTPSLIQAGMTGLFANDAVSAEQSDIAESILRSVGKTLWLNTEESLDVVTAVSGSGPAYYFLMLEAMQSTAQKLGLNAEDSRLLVLETAYGAIKLALESDDDVAILRQRVTSKGGTTEAAVNKLVSGGMVELFEEAIIAAAIRSKELSKL